MENDECSSADLFPFSKISMSSLNEEMNPEGSLHLHGQIRAPEERKLNRSKSEERINIYPEAKLNKLNLPCTLAGSNVSVRNSKLSLFKPKIDMTKVDSVNIRNLAKTDLGLGYVLQNGRTLLYFLIKIVKNGDRIVLKKLDSAVKIEENVDDPDDMKVWIDHASLIDEKYSTNNILKDLLDLQRWKTSRILHHPVMETFIKQRWRKTKWIFLTTFYLYLTFLIIYSTFLGLMFFRQTQVRTYNLDMPQIKNLQCGDQAADRAGFRPVITPKLIKHSLPTNVSNFIQENTREGDKASKSFKSTSLKLLTTTEKKDDKQTFYELVEKITKSRLSNRRRDKLGTFSGCTTVKRFQDLTLCSVEVLLTAILILLLAEELWECLALGLRYFQELESWLKIFIFTFAAISLTYETNIEVLKIFSSLGICLSWLELIFMIGRYPFLGGRFSIMFYSITKRIVQSALAFFIMVVAFGFSFFIINFGSQSEEFENPGKALLKIFVMVLGEFEFDTLYQNSEGSDITLVFTMILLIGLMVTGSIIMLNLIVAFIITDVSNLLETARDQVIVNQANHAIKSDALIRVITKILKKFGYSRPHRISGPGELHVDVCTHTCCNCNIRRMKPELVTAIRQITNNRGYK